MSFYFFYVFFDELVPSDRIYQNMKAVIKFQALASIEHAGLGFRFKKDKVTSVLEFVSGRWLLKELKQMMLVGLLRRSEAPVAYRAGILFISNQSMYSSV